MYIYNITLENKRLTLSFSTVFTSIIHSPFELGDNSVDCVDNPIILWITA